MINILKDALPRPIDCSNKGSAIIPAINKLNSARLDRILRLLDFVEEQGWTYGSAVGSLDHQMNRNGAGYMQAIFVIREYLRRPENTKRLDSLIKSMKWFNDFNEIYQSDEEYIYNGTTADRMRTILLYRLMIILMIPNSRGDEKIRDMQYFKNWAEHSLKINKALGGVVKPDYTGFHHKTFYGSAYVAIAYHNAAFVQYLLSGTSFALGQTARDNLRQGLEGNQHVTAGPVYRVSASCTLMTERESRDLHVALSNPRFQLVEDEAMKNSVTCQEKSGRRVRSVDDINSDDHDGDEEGEDNVEISNSRDAHRIKKREAPGSKSPESAVPIFPHRNSNHVTDDYRYCRKSDETEIVVTLSSSLRVRNMRNVTVDGKTVEKADQEKYLQIEEGGKKIRFSKLANGFTTEAKFEVFEDDNSDAKSGACSLLADSVFKVLLGVALIIALGVASD
ncbi:predicted protein [Nematostella vectensis]|uniref:Lyase catalytic domain-containing protein n=1 Tax=Nematostella vectensis TaxID=45351 RepID=A7T716_NEMVE|nr:predicted protein [Nematostella vectensis]|eukprot:XP_001620337.1 hypothetical protein NEMVEDRAFT_v1g223216 [Nematostella vectensis]